VNDLIASIEAMQIESLQQLDIFSVYQGNNVPKGLKSISLGLILQDISSTLEDKQVDTIVEAIIDQLTKTYNAELRIS
jgi:phenylalanyl-tRNA synthetase beta chain